MNLEKPWHGIVSPDYTVITNEMIRVSGLGYVVLEDYLPRPRHTEMVQTMMLRYRQWDQRALYRFQNAVADATDWLAQRLETRPDAVSRFLLRFAEAVCTVLQGSHLGHDSWEEEYDSGGVLPF